MFRILVFLFLLFVLIVILKVVSLMVSERTVLNREDLTSYECGFEHHSLSRIPFSIRYFFLTLIFLLFDLEVILLLFFPFSFVFRFSRVSLVCVFFFLFFLFLGLVYE